MGTNLPCKPSRYLLWYGLVLQLLLGPLTAVALSSDGFGRYHNLVMAINVKGTVLDETGSPMPGVSILIKGTSTGTVTDIEGEYELSNVSEDGILVFSF